MKQTPYHYTECGLNNVYLINGFNIITTPNGTAISINDIDGLHKAIGLSLVNGQKDLTHEEIRFLRHEMLMSQRTLANLLGVSEQAVLRWEKGKIKIPKPTESLLRLLYREHVQDTSGKIATLLRQIACMEESMQHQLNFKDTHKGWQQAA